MARFLIPLVVTAFFAAIAQARILDQLYKKAELKVGNQNITAYLADTETKREAGLMFIENLPANTGMLFIFEDERPLAFWMKNTLIPLAIGFFDQKGILVDKQEMTVPGSMMTARPPSYPSAKQAQLALEMQKGWFTDHNIKRGQKICRKEKTNSNLTDQTVPRAREPPKKVDAHNQISAKQS